MIQCDCHQRIGTRRICEELHADIKHYLVYELKPLGLFRSSSDYGKILSGIVGSFFPRDAHLAWHEFGARTFQRFLLFLSTARTPQVFNFYATIGVFANCYQRASVNCAPELHFLMQAANLVFSH